MTRTPRTPVPPAAARTAEHRPLAQLVSAALAGCDQAWEDLVLRYQPSLEAVARRYRLCPADVDDVVQRTWEKCHQHLSAVREVDALPGWLTTICRHEALALLRGQQRCRPVHDERMMLALATGQQVAQDGAEDSVDPVDIVIQREQRSALHRAIAELPHRQRLLIEALLRCERSHAYAEVAATLAMPIGSIGPTRRRAIANLRAALRQAA